MHLNIGLIIFYVIIINNITLYSQDKMKYNDLTKEEERVIIHRGTELPNTGIYNNYEEAGIYSCKRCDAQLYISTDKFESHCGWPSFDDEIDGAVKRIPDADGRRTEIVCSNCGGHLGHVFLDEGYTDKNTRHCVNSISLNFIPGQMEKEFNKAIFAGGCFWGMEYHFDNVKGVKETSVGYIGGTTEDPTYKEVCYENTGHAEAIEIEFDPSIVTYKELAKLFFEIHDPTQLNKQGPDVGEQYRSEIFYFDENQKIVAEILINLLKEKGYNVVTKLTKASEFWDAEEYHQEYYEKKNDTPYCHIYTKRF